MLFQMVVTERLKSELLPVGSSDNGGVEGKAALDGTGAPGSSQTPIMQTVALGTIQTEPVGAHSIASKVGVCSLQPAPGPWIHLLPGSGQAYSTAGWRTKNKRTGTGWGVRGFITRLPTH